MDTITSVMIHRRLKERAYKDLQNNNVGIFGINRILKPWKNIYTGEITITNPRGKKEVWIQDEKSIFPKYKRIK